MAANVPATDCPVVTGMGILSAAGDSPSTVWERVVHGPPPARWLAADEVGAGRRLAVCAVADFDVPAFKHLPIARMDRFVQLGVVAAQQAFADAGLDCSPIDPLRLGVLVGTSRGPMQMWEQTLDRVRSGARVPPSLAVNGTLACLSGTLSVALQACGPCLTMSATCASAAYAIALAALQLQAGIVDAVLVGGSEAPLHRAVLAQLDSTRILGQHDDPGRTCRPFDATRNGTIVGEGAAFLVLETEASARRRGVRPYARLAGWALGADARHRAATMREGEGLYRVMEQACKQAGLAPDAVDYVNAHGTGTRQNDHAEACAVRRLLGGRVPCSSTKPITGHCLGATPAIEALIGILALQHQFVPPTVNCLSPDSACPINAVPCEGRPARLRAVMSNSLGFWGYNASLVFVEAKPAKLQSGAGPPLHAAIHRRRSAHVACNVTSTTPSKPTLRAASPSTSPGERPPNSATTPADERATSPSNSTAVFGSRTSRSLR